MTTLTLALAAGAVVGLALGALGAGGSMLTVPALIYLLGFSPAQATTASLLIVATTSLTAVVAHANAGRVRWRTGLQFAAAGLPTAFMAGALSADLPSRVLTGAFAVLAGAAARRLLIVRRVTPAARSCGPGRSVAAGAGLGTVTGLLGVGGGFLAVPALTSVLAVPMAEAVGTSLLVISANAVAALIPRLGEAGAVPWATVGPFTATAVLGAWDGQRIARKLSGPALQRAFAVALMTVATAMLAGALM
ncbi:sulfite exporter TauE/SafE family protein [Streptomyces sp. NPDC091217]|uniref:sulfite exporter TauE/SafE family protein n=1 Tax=Streptomyces sp. NPDC091217 TaxID=3365975 RepID=UPI0038030233